MFKPSMFKRILNNKIYLDYGACAPELTLSAKARKEADKAFANPSSIHKDGLRSKAFLDMARVTCAKYLSANPDEIIFTGSGTESDNLAILGVFKHLKLNDPKTLVHVITTKIEHPAVLEACKHIEKIGGEVTYLSVDKDGLIDLKEFKKSLKPETAIVTISYANSEIGVVQPIREIAKEIRHYRKLKAESLKLKAYEIAYPLFHTDACQAGGYLEMNVDRLGVDLLTMNGTKIGGPRGTGLLYKRRNVKIDGMFYGGGQEQGIRSGTENVSGIYGFAEAFKFVRDHSEKEQARLIKLQEYFISELKSNFPECRINGHEQIRLPNNVNVSFKNFDSELLVLEMDAKGISISAGSACSSTSDKSSHVINALYVGEKEKWGTIRFSFGFATRKSDIDKALVALKKIFEKYSKLK